MIYDNRIIVIGIKWPPETFILRLIDGIADRGFEVFVATEKQPPKEWLEKGNRHWIWKPSWNIHKIDKIAYLMLFISKSIFRKTKELTLLFHYINLKPGFRNKMYRFYQIAPLLGMGSATVYYPWILESKNTLEWFELLRVPILASLRGSIINIYPLVPGKGLNIQSQLRLIFNHSPFIHCVSKDIMEEAGQYGLDFNKAKIIMPAVDPAVFYPLAKKTNNDFFTIVSVGTLIWKKGYEYALIAVRKLIDNGIDAEYHIVGQGPEIQHIQYTIQDLNLCSNVFLHGKLQTKQITELLNKSDVFLLSSLSEGISNAVLEAMSCGLPVVSTNCGGMGEAIEDGVEGFLVATRNPDEITDALVKLARNPALRRKMGRAGRNKVIKDFNLNKQIDEFTGLFSSIALKME